MGYSLKLSKDKNHPHRFEKPTPSNHQNTREDYIWIAGNKFKSLVCYVHMVWPFAVLIIQENENDIKIPNVKAEETLLQINDFFYNIRFAYLVQQIFIALNIFSLFSKIASPSPSQNANFD